MIIFGVKKPWFRVTSILTRGHVNDASILQIPVQKQHLNTLLRPYNHINLGVGTRVKCIYSGSPISTKAIIILRGKQPW